MDPRQPPQHPFSRNTASPYGRSPFPPSSNQAPYPQSSHPSNAAPAYAEHQRRPSDPPYNYPPQRQYSGDAQPLSATSTHSRANSLHGTPVSRMPPPSSPQQGPQHNYGPPPPRAPPVSVGPPSGFPSDRNLPPLGRPGGMSINALLGGSSVSREQSSNYASPVSAGGPLNSLFSGPPHASPRMTTAPEYPGFRRPLTPEHQRYEPRDPRDHRANSAGSPPGMGHYTPEAHRFGTPQRQSYGPRPIQDERQPIRVPNPNAVIPPRPSSQPGYNPPPPRPSDARADDSIFGRRESVRADSLNREPDYRRLEYEERERERREPAYAYAERERQVQERQARERQEAIQIQRERELRDQQREQRERAMNEHSANLQQEYAHQIAQRNAQAYSRAPEPREQPAWMRPGFEPQRPAYEPIPEQQHLRERERERERDRDREREQRERELLNGHEYSRSAQYSGPSYSPIEQRYPSTSQPPTVLNHSIPASQFEASIQERQRLAQQQEQQRQSMYGGPPQNATYQSQDSPTRRQVEDPHQMQQQSSQRSFLVVQEINRKGRVSPLPQAVQGAQGQIGGPGGEPGIKSEFGRMFSGIGSGVGAMGAPSPVTAGPQGMPGQLRREDLESPQGLDSPTENGGYKLARSPSRGGRRRKLKEEDGRDDDSSTGRRTPSGSGRGKRPKSHHHHHHNHHHHHHHRGDPLDQNSSPSQSNNTPFKNIKGTAIPSPPDAKAAPALHHHHVPRHHHHQVPPSKPAQPLNPVIPMPKTTIRSKAVLDVVSHLERKHLGHAYYQSRLKPLGTNVNRPKTKRGFASTPKPLPNFEGSENCTFTIRVPRIHVASESREEITFGRAIWGTDVYTDDSDIIAACIHQGWFRGEWADDVDTSLLDLVLDDEIPEDPKEYLEEPPARGPMYVPKNRDLHVTILVLPQLEKYSSTTRFGIRSREWGGKHDDYQGVHDGLSFMILNIRWVDGIDTVVGRSGGERRKLMAELEDDEREAEERWGELFDGIRTNGNGNGGLIEESFERGGAVGGDIVGIGTKSWWKQPTNIIAKRTVNGAPGAINGAPHVIDEAPERELQEAEKVPPPQLPAETKKTDIEKVTDIMVVNANVHAGESVDMMNIDTVRPGGVDEITAV